MSNFATTDFFVDQAVRVIEGTYGDDVSVEDKQKDLLKFGQNTSVGTSNSRYTIWYTGQDEPHETYAADDTNPIDSLSSNSNSDSEVVRVEGHTMAGGNKTFVVQNITLNGRTRVPLTTPLNRCTRVAHAQQSNIDLIGEIYAYENTSLTAGKPSDTTKIHVTVPEDENTSQKCSTSLSSTDYWLVTSISAGSLEKSGSNTTDVRLEVRPSGGVFLPVSKPLVINTGEDDVRNFKPYLIIPKNADVILTAISSAAGQHITGDISGYLAAVVS